MIAACCVLTELSLSLPASFMQLLGPKVRHTFYIYFHQTLQTKQQKRHQINQIELPKHHKNMRKSQPNQAVFRFVFFFFLGVGASSAFGESSGGLWSHCNCSTSNLSLLRKDRTDFPPFPGKLNIWCCCCCCCFFQRWNPPSSNFFVISCNLTRSPETCIPFEAFNLGKAQLSKASKSRNF